MSDMRRAVVEEVVGCSPGGGTKKNGSQNSAGDVSGVNIQGDNQINSAPNASLNIGNGAGTGAAHTTPAQPATGVVNNQGDNQIKAAPNSSLNIGNGAGAGDAHTTPAQPATGRSGGCAE